MKTTSENFTEKGENKIFAYLGLAVGIATLGILSWQIYKSSKKMKKEEAKAKQDIEDLGVSPEKLKKEVKYHERDNFVKTLFVSTTFCDTRKAPAILDNDVLETEEAFNHPNVVHIFQKRRSDIWTGGNFINCYNQNFIEFVLEIPDYINDDRRLHISDYKRCLKDAARYLSETYGKFCPLPERELFGWLNLKYDNPDYDPKDEHSHRQHNGFVELPRWIYKDFEGDHRPEFALTKLYEKVTKENSFGETEENVRNLISSLYPGKNVGVYYMGLAYRIVFPIKDDANWMGLTLKDALNCINYLCNVFEITKEPDTRIPNNRLTYRHILFHSPNSKGKWSWRRFYDVGEDHSVIEVDYNRRKRSEEEEQED